MTTEDREDNKILRQRTKLPKVIHCMICGKSIKITPNTKVCGKSWGIHFGKVESRKNTLILSIQFVCKRCDKLRRLMLEL